MRGEPEVIPQNRGEGMDGTVENHWLTICENQRGHRHRNGSQQEVSRAVNHLKDQGKEDCPKGDPDDRFIHIGDRRSACYQDTRGKSTRLEKKSAEGQSRCCPIAESLPGSP